MQPDPQLGRGWFSVTSQLAPHQVEAVSQGQIRSGPGPQDAGCDVLEVAVQGARVSVRTSITTPQTSLDLHVPVTSQVLSGLGRGLDAVRDNPLLSSFASRTLTPVPTHTHPRAVPGWRKLRPAQLRAVAACCGPGLQLVWGPPGTGKAHVIATSVNHLANSGRRVLLVSSTDVAVDGALSAVIRLMRPRDGQVVRLGTIHLRSLADDPGVNVDRLAQARYRELQQRLAELESTLEKLDQLDSDLAAAETELAQAQAGESWARRAVLAVICRDAASRESAVRTTLGQVRDELSRLEDMPWWARIGRRGETTQLRVRRLALVNDLARAGALLREAQDDAQLGGADREAAGEWSLDEIRAEHAQATERLTVARENLSFIRLTSNQQRVTVTAEYEQLERRIQQRKTELRQTIVAGAQVVATTVTQIAVHSWITEDVFDHVIVVDAAAVPFPHLVHAVGRAQIGAVLVGDYLQSGPVPDNDFPGSDFPGSDFPGGDEVRAAFSQDSFGYFDVTEPIRAERIPGCVVLTEQFHVGPMLTELANRVAYDLVLTDAGPGSGDIVVITVDDRPGPLGTIDRAGEPHAGWWPIGALLARALAEQHQNSESFGVIVPYTKQREATLAALEDGGLGAGRIRVGTSSAFQGQHLDVVLADLVEDGDGWIAQARRGGRGYSFDGVRMFTVAATRARRRLYLLLTRNALERARFGPLADLKEMTGRGKAELVDAAELFGGCHSEQPARGSAEADLRLALEEYVRVGGRLDDETIREVINRIDDAERSIWCWNAWLGKPAIAITEALERAAARGVTVQLRDPFQKLIVIDDRWSIIGSADPLPDHPTASQHFRDYTVIVNGRRFAENLRAHEQGRETSAQPSSVTSAFRGGRSRSR